jgi:hypothetical protein
MRIFVAFLFVIAAGNLALAETSVWDEVTIDPQVEPASVDFAEGPGLIESTLLNPNREPFWFAGTEFTFVDVQAKTGGLITLSYDDATTGGTEIAFRDGQGYDDYAVAPRLWLGRKFGEKWGVVGRYWHMSGNNTQFPALAPGVTPLPTFGTYNEFNRMQAYTIDVEGIRTFRPGNWILDLSVGARHASYNSDSQIETFGVITTGNFANVALSNGCAFDGTGVTYALGGRRRIMDTHAHFFFTARGTRAEGESDSFGRSAGTVASSPSAPLVGAATVTRNDSDAVMNIGEFQVGVEWEYPLVCLPANFFFRTAYEYQYWNFEGRPTGGAGFGGTIGDLTTNSFASAGLGDMTLMGLSIGTGLTW